MPTKISALPQQSTPAVTDKVPVVSGGQTDYELLSDLITLFFNNIPAGAHSDVTRGADTIFDHVVGITGAITGDSVGVNRNASMTALTCYINGRRITISAVSARTYTASKDTYVDVLDNLDGTGTLVYTEVTNNAASPALAANSIRIGIVVTGATTIAAATSINQGEIGRLLPIASSIPYETTDSLGNLICSRDPNRRLLGYRQITANQAIVATSAAALPTNPLSCPIIAPNVKRKIVIKSYTPYFQTQTNVFNHTIWDGAVGGGTQLQNAAETGAGGGFGGFGAPEVEIIPALVSKTFNVGAHMSASTGQFQASSTGVAYIKVTLE